jgi:hypothetical protein
LLYHELIKLHGSSVHVESEVDRGSTFSSEKRSFAGKSHTGRRHPGLSWIGRRGISGRGNKEFSGPSSAKTIFNLRILLGRQARGALETGRRKTARILLADDNPDIRKYGSG